jgi:isopentenyl diphosphate isomerase/L-lactate dehydrogenase-like FMN-dependent dehydrogenase
MGGRPDVGRAHFERAVALSEGRNLLAKVMFAESYARLVFDRDLHDTLLGEVLSAPVQAPGLTLMNTVAKGRARELLESADDYF